MILLSVVKREILSFCNGNHVFVLCASFYILLGHVTFQGWNKKLKWSCNMGLFGMTWCLKKYF